MKSKNVRAGVYRHYKGQFYLVLGVARNSETEERLVVYVPLYVREGPRMCVRPFDMFFETITVGGVDRPRFEYIGSDVSDSLLT